MRGERERQRRREREIDREKVRESERDWGWRVVCRANSGDAMGYGSWCHDGVGCWRKGRGGFVQILGILKKGLIFRGKIRINLNA